MMKIHSTRERGMAQRDDMRWSCLSKGIRAAMLGLFTGFAFPLHAEEDIHSFVRALTEAAVDAAVAEPGADTTLRALLALKEPWQDGIVAQMESTPAFARLREAGAGLAGPSLGRYRKLLEAVAERQGASSLAQMRQHQPVGELPIDFKAAETHWVTFSATGTSGEMRVGGSDCTPSIAVFDGTLPLPAAPLAGALRFTSDLAHVHVTPGDRVRIRPGNCARDQVVLMTEWVPGRRTAQDSRAVPLVVPYDLTVIVPIGPLPARKFTVRTEPNTVYEVFAAQVDADDDPVLLKSDSKDPVKVSDVDDDGGWGLGARLGPYVGTGDEVAFLARRMSQTTSSTAVYVRRVPATDHQASSPHVFKLASNATEWLRMPLEKGVWTVRTRSSSKKSDPYVRAYSASDGELIDESDDISEDELDARITVSMADAGVVFLRLSTAGDEGSEFRLEVTPGNASTALECGPDWGRNQLVRT